MLDTIAERIQYALDQSGIARTEIADACGVSRQAVAGWVKTGRISKEAMYVVAEKTGFNAEWLATKRGPQRVVDEGEQPRLKTYPAYRYPVISWATAVKWGEVADPYAPGVAEDWISSAYRGSPRTFMLRVRDDSMATPIGTVSFNEGVYIVVDPEVEPENSVYVIAQLSGVSDITFRQLVIDGTGRYLRPLNRDYRVTPIDEECQILGVVKAIEVRW